MEKNAEFSDEKYSFFMVKPDGVQRGLVNNIFEYLECAGLEIGATQSRFVDPDLVDEHYNHVPDHVLDDLHEYFDNEDVVAGILHGNNPVERTREIVGDNFRPEEDSMLTIRGSAVKDPTSEFYDKELIPHYDSRISEEWGLPLYNLVHASTSFEESIEEAERFMERDEDGNYIDEGIP